MLQLHTYWRSSASYRVRIALGLKGLPFSTKAVHLTRGGGEQHGAEFRALNPLGRVPALDDDGQIITQSLAIIEYLEERHPLPPLLPSNALARARVRALAQIIACDIQPLQNTSTTAYLRDELAATPLQISSWLQTFIGRGLGAIEALLINSDDTGRFCQGNMPGLADCCLIPQCYAARRFGVAVDSANFPRTFAIEQACLAMPAFAQAAPERQADRE